MSKIKVAMIGSRLYENRPKIMDALSDLKRRFNNEVIIISGGASDGADKYVKKYALEFGMEYKEYNPAHTPRNLYSCMPASYYGKPYHVSQFHHRNLLIARTCDYMVAFVPPGKMTNGTASAIKYIKKLKKPFVIIT